MNEIFFLGKNDYFNKFIIDKLNEELYNFSFNYFYDDVESFIDSLNKFNKKNKNENFLIIIEEPYLIKIKDQLFFQSYEKINDNKYSIFGISDGTLNSSISLLRNNISSVISRPYSYKLLISYIYNFFNVKSKSIFSNKTQLNAMLFENNFHTSHQLHNILNSQKNIDLCFELTCKALCENLEISQVGILRIDDNPKKDINGKDYFNGRLAYKYPFKLSSNLQRVFPLDDEIQYTLIQQEKSSNFIDNNEIIKLNTIDNKRKIGLFIENINDCQNLGINSLKALQEDEVISTAFIPLILNDRVVVSFGLDITEDDKEKKLTREKILIANDIINDAQIIFEAFDKSIDFESYKYFTNDDNVYLEPIPFIEKKDFYKLKKEIETQINKFLLEISKEFKASIVGIYETNAYEDKLELKYINNKFKSILSKKYYEKFLKEFVGKNKKNILDNFNEIYSFKESELIENLDKFFEEDEIKTEEKIRIANNLVIKPLKIGQGMGGRIVESNEAYEIVDDYDNYYYKVENYPDGIFGKVLSVPISSLRGNEGVLFVSRKGMKFSRFDAIILELYSKYISNLMLNLENFKHEYFRDEISRLITDVDKENNLNEIVDGIKEVFNCSSVVLFVNANANANENSDEITLEHPPYYTGIKNENELIKSRFVRKKSIVYQCFEKDKYTLIPDTENNEILKESKFHERENVKSFIAIPLTIKNQKNKKIEKRLGLLFVNYSDNFHYFTKDEIKKLLFYADQAAIAIYKSKLDEEAKKNEKYLKILDDVNNKILNYKNQSSEGFDSTETSTKIISEAMDRIKNELSVKWMTFFTVDPYIKLFHNTDYRKDNLNQLNNRARIFNGESNTQKLSKNSNKLKRIFIRNIIEEDEYSTPNNIYPINNYVKWQRFITCKENKDIKNLKRKYEKDFLFEETWHKDKCSYSIIPKDSILDKKEKFIQFLNELDINKNIEKIEQVTSVLGLPISINKEKVGVLWFHFTENQYFTEEEIENLNVLFNTITIAYHNAINTNIEKHYDKVIKTIEEIQGIEEEASTIDTTIECIKTILQADEVIFYNKTSYLYEGIYSKEPLDSIKQFITFLEDHDEYKNWSDVYYSIYDKTNSEINNDFKGYFQKIQKEDSRFLNIVIFPLRKDANIIGYIVIKNYSEKFFTKNIINDVKRFVNLIVVTVNNNKLFQNSNLLIEINNSIMEKIDFNNEEPKKFQFEIKTIQQLNQLFEFDRLILLALDTEDLQVNSIENKHFYVLDEYINGEKKNSKDIFPCYMFLEYEKDNKGFIKYKFPEKIQSEDESTFEDFINEDVFKSTICVPIKTPAVNHGLIILQNRLQDIFTKEDNNNLHQVANSLAIGLGVYHNYYINLLQIKTINKIEKQIMFKNFSSDVLHKLPNILGTVPYEINSIKENLKSIENLDDFNFFKKYLNSSFSSLNRDIENIFKMIDKWKKDEKYFKEKDFSINKVIKAVYYNSINPKNIDVSLNLDDYIPDVYGSYDLFFEAMNYLFENSIDALKNVQNGQIKISTKYDKSKIIIDFKDNGSGIAEIDKQRIFDFMYTTKENGFGYGLFRAKSILAEFNATIKLMDKETSGTHFQITIEV